MLRRCSRLLAPSLRVSVPTRYLAPPSLSRTLCASSTAKPPSGPADAAAAAGEPGPAQPELTGPDGSGPTVEAGAFTTSEEINERDKSITLSDHEGDNLPPLQFEPGVAGAAQKGVSAIVIVFGAAAFGACAYGISLALFPSATSTQSIYSEAFDKVKFDPDVSLALGSPLRAFGIDHGSERGRRNAMERWEVQENGTDYSVVRFTVAGPQGAGLVQVQVPANRRRGEFRYIIFEDRSRVRDRNANRRLVHVLDRRADEMAAAAAAADKAAAEAAAAAPAATTASG